MKTINYHGQDYELEFNPEARWTWAVAFPDEFGSEIVRVHRGYKTHQSAVNGLKYQLRKLDKEELPAMGKVFNLENEEK